MNAASAIAKLRAYAPPGGSAALAVRLQRMAAAGDDDVCATYFDLRPPSARSPLHVRTTYLLADVLVNGGADLPLPLDTVVPMRWRLLVATSLGRVQDVGVSLAPSAAAAPGSLLTQFCTYIAELDQLSGARFRQAIQLLWRLGAKQTVVNLYGAESETNLIARVRTAARPSDVTSTTFLQQGTSDALEEALLNRAKDPALAISERVRIVRFVLVRRGKARQPAGDRLARAYATATAILQDLSDSADIDGFRSALLKSALHRAMAFQPFLTGRVGTAIDHLTKADNLLTAQGPNSSALQMLLWDHHFPVLETLSQTANLLGKPELADEAAHRLVALDPYDARSWFALGKVMIGREDPLGAATAFTAAASCELAQKARACYFAAVAYAEAGQVGTARHWLRCSSTLDPTPPALESLSCTW